jgi:hypothetical protein
MYLDSIFDELGLVRKLETSSRTLHKETTRTNKIGRCKVCKVLSLLGFGANNKKIINLTNVLDEGLRIGEIGRRMNSKVLVEISVYRK